MIFCTASKRAQHVQQRRVEAARTCNIRSRRRIRSRSRSASRKRAQPRVVVGGEARRYSPNGSGTSVSGLPRLARDQLAVGNVVGRLAQAVHVVGKGDQPRLDLDRRSARGRRGAPWWCARPRRTCRYAAGPRGRSRSRTAPLSGRCARRARRACAPPRTARPWRSRGFAPSGVRHRTSTLAKPAPPRATRGAHSRKAGFQVNDFARRGALSEIMSPSGLRLAKARSGP